MAVRSVIDMKKRIFSLLVAVLWTLCAGAQDIIADMPNVHVYQDSTITRLMQDKCAGIIHGKQEVNGWRVQVYSSNSQRLAKEEAENLAKRLQNEVDEPVYVISQQPFWKVRLGNFLTQEDAIAYRDRLFEALPEFKGTAYVVRDEHVEIIR